MKRLVFAAALVLAVGLALAEDFAHRGQYGWMLDISTYRLGALQALHGQSLYFNSIYPPFTYPPFAALVFLPLAPLSKSGLALVSIPLSLLCLGISIWICLGWTGGLSERRRLLLVAAAGLLAVPLDPVEQTLSLGQVDLVLMALVLADLAMPDSSRWKGGMIGIAAGVKLIPVFFILYLLATRRWRAAGVATATLAATVGVAFMVLPKDSVAYWGELVFKSGRVGDPQNPNSQSLLSLLTRWLHTADVRPAWLLLSLVVAVLSLVVAARASRRGDELLAVCVCAAATLLITPISWQHHWVWIVPMLIWLARSRSRVLWVAALLVAADFYLHPYRGIRVDPVADLHLSMVQLLMASCYTVVGILFLAMAGATTRTPRPSPEAARP
jgi:alpha-1,2-mannosyltransferase